nr:carboxylesterase family protein [Colletotrichum truncatum]KAF6793647.1 carboxylesterase family protein [Colletotrichum truncatum]
MARLSRSGLHAHEVVEDHTATAPNQHAAIDANVSFGDKTLTILQNHNTNIDQSSPDFIDSLTNKLKDLHIYSPKENRGDRSLLAAHQRPTRSSIVHETLPIIDPVGKETGNCDNPTAETTHAQGPFPAEPPRLSKQNEGIPSLAETHASSVAATHQTPDTFEASFPSKVLRASNLDHHPLGTDPDIQSSIAKHQAGQYDYVLSLLSPLSTTSCEHSPIDQRESTLKYGCNVLLQSECPRKSVCCQGKPANTYKILATPLGDEDVVLQDTPQQILVKGDEEIMAVAEPIARFISPTSAGDETMPNKFSQSGVTFAVVEQSQPEPQDALAAVVEHSKDSAISFSNEDVSVETPRTPSRSTSASSRSRIEDSVEALDRLEEQLEAIDAAITPPSKSRRLQAAMDESTTTKAGGLHRTSSLLKRGQTDRATPTTPQARRALKKSVSVTTTNQDESSPAKSATKRSSVSRPTSLLPPKPPARSTKPPTKPSFELPGEAVARRIKEQRETRLAQQAQEKAAAAAVPQRTRSTRAPTRPNFELPGEAISRRKRAEREAKLKAQEEEERKRREFKARPIRANLTSASYPRETATSRARQSKGPELNEIGQVGHGGPKRSSIVGAPRAPLTKSGSTRSPQVRGRGISQTSSASPQLNRAASISASSVSSKRSTLSAEDVEQQKVKGRAVFERDNSYIEDKERERREREFNTKLAREQAAERSRQASREWAEKQRRKQLVVANAVAA